MRSGGGFNRRSFLIGASAAGGGLALGFAIPFGPQRSAVSAQAQAAPEITCWLTIARDDTVTIRVAHSEMGQGVLTGLAMLVAEELECDWSKVRTQLVSVTENLRRNNAWGDTSTGASRSIASSQLYLRQAGATARDMLITAAAARWNVPAAQCTAYNSTITHKPSGRTLSYGAVAEDAASVEPSTDIRLKAPTDWKLAGTPRSGSTCATRSPASRSMRSTCGSPTCSTPPSCIARCSGHAEVIDESSIAGMKGVRRVVRMTDAVAVVANSWWRAKCAADALKVTGTSAAMAISRALRSRNWCAAGSTRRRASRPQARRCRVGARRRRQAHRGRLRRAVPRPRHDGAAELHRACEAR